MKSIVIVMPIYEDVEASNRLFRELSRVFGDDLFVVAVDDGSVRSPQSASNLKAAGVEGVVLRLKRNVGHQKAIAIGLGYVYVHWADTPYTVVMDSDGEDLPDSIPTLIEAAKGDDKDMAVSQRRSRVETWKFLLFYQVYKWLFKVFAGRTISFGNFMVLKPQALKRLANMHELWTHIAGCVLLSKLRVATCPLDRGPRYAGKSKMNFVGLALHGFKALMVFSEDVLVRVGVLCSAIVALAIAGVVATVVLKVCDLASPGWFSLTLGILGIVILQAGGLALSAFMSLMVAGLTGRSGMAKITYEDYLDYCDSAS